MAGGNFSVCGDGTSFVPLLVLSLLLAYQPHPRLSPMIVRVARVSMYRMFVSLHAPMHAVCLLDLPVRRHGP